MSEPYQLTALQPNGLPPAAAIRRVHLLLGQWDVVVADDSLLLLHDTAEFEPEVEPVSGGEDIIQRIIDWPTLGTLDYGGPEGIVSVSYLGTNDPFGFVGVLISAQERSVERTDSIGRYQEIGRELHRNLPARRTIMAWGLTMSGFRWREEVERLRAGIVEGEYPLLDLPEH